MNYVQKFIASTAVALAAGVTFANGPAPSTNLISGSATSKSQGFTESFVSIGANATASQTASAQTSGVATVTGIASGQMAEVTTLATQTSLATASGSFEGTVGPSPLPSFSNAGAFSFSGAEGVATIPTFVLPGNSGNAGGNGNNNAGGNNGGGNSGGGS